MDKFEVTYNYVPLPDFLPVNHWESKTFSGSWYGPSAGGSRNFPDTFHKNPQIRIKLEDDANEDGKCTVIIALMQCNRRRQKVVGRQNLTMGFAIYNVRSCNNLRNVCLLQGYS